MTQKYTKKFKRKLVRPRIYTDRRGSKRRLLCKELSFCFHKIAKLAILNKLTLKGEDTQKGLRRRSHGEIILKNENRKFGIGIQKKIKRGRKKRKRKIWNKRRIKKPRQQKRQNYNYNSISDKQSDSNTYYKTSNDKLNENLNEKENIIYNEQRQSKETKNSLLMSSNLGANHDKNSKSETKTKIIYSSSLFASSVSTLSSHRCQTKPSILSSPSKSKIIIYSKNRKTNPKCHSNMDQKYINAKNHDTLGMYRPNSRIKNKPKSRSSLTSLLYTLVFLVNFPTFITSQFGLSDLGNLFDQNSDLDSNSDYEYYDIDYDAAYRFGVVGRHTLTLYGCVVDRP